MTARVLDGKAVARQIFDEVSRAVAARISAGGSRPKLATVLVGDDPASVQYVELNLAAHKGRAPLELFGQTKFPAIGELPYLLTLGAHEFYWFALEEPKAAADVAREAAYQPPAIEAIGVDRRHPVEPRGRSRAVRSGASDGCCG